VPHIRARRAGCYDKMLFDAVTTHVATHFTKYETEQLLKVRAPMRGLSWWNCF